MTTAYMRSGYQNPEAFYRDYGIAHVTNRRVNDYFSAFREPEKAFSHTIYLYLVSVVPKEKQREAREALIRQESGYLETLAYQVRRGVSFPLYCPVYALEDMDLGNKEHPYFRTYHNMGGMTVCPHYGARLVECREPLFNPVDSKAIGEIEFREDFEQSIARTIRNFKGLNKKMLDKVLYNFLFEKDLNNAKGKVKRTQVIEELYEKYPEGFLQKHQIIRRDIQRTWIKNLLDSGHLTHPFYYALLFDLLNFNIKQYLLL